MNQGNSLINTQNFIEKNLINKIMDQLGFTDDILVQRNIEHFTEKEGGNRDQIVEGYFGKDGMKLIISKIVEVVDGKHQQLLDLGVGTGTFLLPVINTLTGATAYALDATPKMLQILKTKILPETEIEYILGDMEKIKFSLQLNMDVRNIELPLKYSSIISTLALHHIPDTKAVFHGISQVLDDDGVAIIIDTIQNPETKMNIDPEHAHNGFDEKELLNLGQIYFSNVQLSPLGISCCDENCDSSGNALFILVLSKPIIK